MKKSARVLLLLGLLVLTSTLMLTGCGKSDGDATEPSPEAVEETIYCPLDHEELSALPERVFAVSIDNGAKSEPQSGLSIADTVFELPVEGGITRFLAVFYHNQLDTIGPVRSARHYYIDLVQSFNGIYVHCGGSYIAKEALSAGAVADIDEMAYGSEFWRDDKRQKPTNLYTSWENLNGIAESKDMPLAGDISGFTFYEDDELQGLSQGDVTTIDIPYTYKPVSYTWDAKSGSYLRFSNGSPHMDAANDTQIFADNVVVLRTAISVIDPNSGILDMSFVANSGSGILFQKGNATPITWSMGQEFSPLVLTLEDGTEAKLAPGKTIFQVVDEDMAVDYGGAAPAEGDVPDEGNNSQE